MISYERGEGVTQTTDSNGEAIFSDLANGYYEIKETQPPAGYILKGDSIFYIRVNGQGIQSVIKADGTAPSEWQPDTTQNGPITYDAETMTVTVGNTPGTALPQTGGIGTTLFTALGGLMTATAGVILTIRRKRKPAEG